jgi:hypothetical protein
MNPLQKLIEQGFSFRSLPAYPRHVAVEKYHCAALLEMTPDGVLKQFSAAGYLLDSNEIALLIERHGRSVFVYKAKEVAADNELLADYQRFVQELNAVLS